MINTYTNFKEMPADINLSLFSRHFINNLETSYMFICNFPNINNGYPDNVKGLLDIQVMDKHMKFTYYTLDKRIFVSTQRINANTALKWYRVNDTRHVNTAINNKREPYPESAIRNVVNTYIGPYTGEAALRASFSGKLTNQEYDNYAKRHHAVINRSAGAVSTVPNNGTGIRVRGSNIVGYANNGISAPRTRSWWSTLNNIYGHSVDGENVITGNKMVLRSTHRPVLNTVGTIPAHWNRGIVIRADVRWKLFFNGRDGRTRIDYPSSAKEVLVQFYSDFGGAGVVNGANVVGRMPMYTEFPILHFLPHVYNRVIQDNSFIEHSGNSVWSSCIPVEWYYLQARLQGMYQHTQVSGWAGDITTRSLMVRRLWYR